MKITVSKDGVVLSTHTFLTESLRIGRSKTNEIVLPDTSVSRDHGVFLIINGEPHFKDLQSANGTLMGGQRITQVRLKPGDFLKMGVFEVKIENDPKFDPDRTVQWGEEVEPMDSTLAEMTTAAVSKQEKTEFDAPLPEPEPEPSLKVLQNFLKDDEPPAEEASDARILHLDGPEAGTSIPLEDADVTLGKQEASIERSEGKYVLKSLEEITNTFVDGVPVRERELENHDIIQIGSGKYEFLQGTSRSRMEGSKVFERQAKTRLSRPKSLWRILQPYLNDWRVLAGIGTTLGLLVLLMIRPTPSPEPVVPQPSVPVQESEEEKTRLIRFQIDRASQLFIDKKYDEAEIRLNNLLQKLAPNNREAIMLLQKVDAARTIEERSLVDRGAISASKRNTLKTKNLPKKEQLARLKKFYQKGIDRYDRGDYSTAETYLTEVANSKNPNQKTAKRILKEIQKKQSKKLQQKLDEVEDLFNQEDPKALLEARSLAQKNPDSHEAIALFNKIQESYDAKAKKAYMDGITFLEVVEDKPAAMERFQEALRLSPDPNSRYYQKAKRKILELQGGAAEK